MTHRSSLRALIVALAALGLLAAEVRGEDAEMSPDTASAAAQPETGAAMADAEQPAQPLTAAYQLEIRRTGEVLEIEGTVPDEPARRAVLAAASDAFPDLPQTILLREKPGAPEDFTSTAVRAIGLLGLFAEGDVQVSGQQAIFSGATYHARARAEFDAAAGEGWPDGYAVNGDQVTTGPSGPTLEAAACELELHALTTARPFEFEAGRADIRDDSKALIDQVAFAAARCPDGLIAVAGHTDSDGTDEANYRLSLDRARTVIDLLVADGIARPRFTALGYGESRPLASNGTLAGKARNRRIEFVLRD